MTDAGQTFTGSVGQSPLWPCLDAFSSSSPDFGSFTPGKGISSVGRQLNLNVTSGFPVVSKKCQHLFWCDRELF